MGARGAVILAYKNRELGDPLGLQKPLCEASRNQSNTEENLELLEDDYVIVGFADIYPRALEGALAVRT